MTRTTFVAGMVALQETYPGEVSEMLQEIYWDTLKDLTDDEFKMAVKTAILSTVEYRPKPGQLRALARPTATAEAIHDVFQTIERKCWEYDPSVGQCWSVKLVHEKCGPLAAVAFKAMGGHSAMQDLDTGNNRTFAVKRFEDEYLAAQEAGTNLALLGEPSTPVSALMREVADLIGNGAKRLPAGK